jgi:hypothetical protein
MVDLKIVTPVEDKATVEALTKLLEQAQKGAVVGLAYIALHQGAAYSGDVIGRAKSFPIYTLGLVRALEHLLSSFIR